MAVCVFDGTDDKISFPIPTELAAVTFAAIIQRGANGTWDGIITHHDSGGTAHSTMEVRDDNRLMFGNLNDSGDLVTPTILAADGWQLIAVTKPSGSSLPRAHRYLFDTDTWTHANTDDSAVATGNATVGGHLELGAWAGTDNFDGKIAVAAEWDDNLSDADIEALVANLNTSDWTGHATAPSWVVEPGFQPGGTVEDLIGANDSTSIDGTTIDLADDPAGWTFSAGGGEPPAAPAPSTLATLGVG